MYTFISYVTMRELFHKVVLTRMALDEYVRNSKDYTPDGYRERYEHLEREIETFMKETDSPALVRILLHQSYFTWEKYMELTCT